MTPKRVVFVCTGNSCRSVMAQYLLQDMLKRAGVETVQVDSAGVFAVEGMEASRETQRLLTAQHIDCGKHKELGTLYLLCANLDATQSRKE